MSVRKRQWTTAKGECKESWVIDYVDQAGKRHMKTFARKKEADAALARTLVEVQNGVHTASSQSVTVTKAAELWLETCEQAKLERSTTVAYRQHIDIHIIPFIGNKKLSELTAPLVREFEDKLRRGAPAGMDDEGSVRSAPMTKKVIGSLGAILADAQERGLVSRNVVRELRSNRKRGKEKRSERRQKGKLKVGVDIPTREEIKAIVKALKGRWRPFMLTAIFTGLRASELRGLRWEDVDLSTREIHVRQRADRFKEIGKPKSEAGERTLPFPPMVMNALKEWKLACPKTDEDLVFPTKNGTVEYHSNIIKRALWPAQIMAGITVPVVDADGKQKVDGAGKPIVKAKYSGLHSLRHFYASWCINRVADGGLGLPAKVVQERLGHSTIGMTLDVYGHLFPRGDDRAEMELAEKNLLA